MKTAGLNHAKVVAATTDQKTNYKQLAHRAIKASRTCFTVRNLDTSLKRIKLRNTHDNGGIVLNIQKRGETKGASRISQSSQKPAMETRGMILNKKRNK